MGERRARSARQVGSHRYLAATALAVLGVLMLTLGADRLVGSSIPSIASHASHPAVSPAAFPIGAVTARLTGTLPALPPGPVPLALAASPSRLEPGWCCRWYPALSSSAWRSERCVSGSAGRRHCWRRRRRRSRRRSRLRRRELRPCRGGAPSLLPRPGRPSSWPTSVLSRRRARSSPSARRRWPLPPTRLSASSLVASSIRRRPDYSEWR